MRGTIGGAIGAVALLLAGCAPDYSAVRDWSSLAAASVDHPALPRSITAQPARLARIGASEMDAGVADAGRPGRQAATAGLQDAASAWLAMLALMAEDGQPLARTNPLAAAAAQVAPVDAQAATAVTNLGAVMVYAARRNYRAPSLAYVLAPADGPFRAVLAALRMQAGALADDEVVEREALARFFGQAMTATADPGARLALEEALALRTVILDAQVAGRIAYVEVLDRIEAGHGLLVERQRVLSQAETARMLRAHEAALRRAAGQLRAL